MSGKIFVLPNYSNAEIRKTGSLKRIFQGKIRYTIIGATALFAFILTRNQDSSMAFISQEIPAVPFYMETTFAPLVIITVGLIIEHVIQYKKRKRES